MKFCKIFLLLIISVYLFSCGTQHKVPNYLENAVDTSFKGQVKFPQLIIQKNDQLSIQIYSLSTQPEKSDVLYNLPASGGITGYLVDVNGNIEVPRLGTFHAEGLTKQELAVQIKKRLTEPVELLKDPTVIIRFSGFRIIVMGEVGHEGPISVPVEKLTILEAMGMAGGITPYGKKETVRVIRENNGIREIGIINVASKDVFDSPYYNLTQNDIVIVDPTKQKAKQTESAITTGKITFALSIITTAAFLYNIFR